MTTDESKVISAPDEDLGFPAGYFVLRNTGSDRMLDVERSGIDDGTEVILFPETEKSLVEGALVLCSVFDVVGVLLWEGWGCKAVSERVD